jgi:hypothetical protein
MKRRTEIIVETERLILIRRRRREKSCVLWCAPCGAESVMLPVEEAARMLGASTMSVFRLAEAGQLHWTETQEGALLICRTSLLQHG